MLFELGAREVTEAVVAQLDQLHPRREAFLLGLNDRWLGTDRQLDVTPHLAVLDSLHWSEDLEAADVCVLPVQVVRNNDNAQVVCRDRRALDDAFLITAVHWPERDQNPSVRLVELLVADLLSANGTQPERTSCRSCTPVPALTDMRLGV